MLAQIEPGSLFIPLVLTRCVAFSIAVFLLLTLRLPWPSLTSNPPAVFAGLLDAGGNVFFLLAKQYTRLDIATVLASLYPVATVLLARVILKEYVSNSQWIGMIVCLAALALITF